LFFYDPRVKPEDDVHYETDEVNLALAKIKQTVDKKYKSKMTETQ